MSADSKQLSPALSQVFGSKARTRLVAVLAEKRDEWLTAATLCDLADVSQSGFHRDHKPVLLDFELMERRDGDEDAEVSPSYALADTEQAEQAAKLHYALQSALENTGPLLEGDVSRFTR